MHNELQLLNICHSHSVIVDFNLNALKSLNVAFTPKPYILFFNIGIIRTFTYVHSVES